MEAGLSTTHDRILLARPLDGAGTGRYALRVRTAHAPRPNGRRPDRTRGEPGELLSLLLRRCARIAVASGHVAFSHTASGAGPHQGAPVPSDDGGHYVCAKPVTNGPLCSAVGAWRAPARGLWHGGNQGGRVRSGGDRLQQPRSHDTRYPRALARAYARPADRAIATASPGMDRQTAPLPRPCHTSRFRSALPLWPFGECICWITDRRGTDCNDDRHVVVQASFATMQAADLRGGRSRPRMRDAHGCRREGLARGRIGRSRAQARADPSRCARARADRESARSLCA